jgi:hypothetical protein
MKERTEYKIIHRPITDCGTYRQKYEQMINDGWRVNARSFDTLFMSRVSK